MRIRSIRPEFWSSEDIAALDIPTRLLFIGLWSYVDDNGVGRDVEKLIRSELFPLDDNPRDTLATVSRGLQALSAGGQISRYIVDGKPYLHVTAWGTHQKIDRPGKDRYPLPTREDAQIRETVATPSRQSRDTPSTGEGEKGRRGEGKNIGRQADRFDEFWSAYPKRGTHSNPKEPARQKWLNAVKSEDPQVIIEAVQRFARLRDGQDPQLTPQAATWLHQRRWKDDPPEPHRPALTLAYTTPPPPKFEDIPAWT